RVVRRSPKERMGKYWLVYAPEPYVHASFFNYIFLKFRRNENPECVLEHEQAHARRLHSLDVLLCECLCIIQWFNPIARLFRKSLCEIHEFEADALTAQKFDKEKYASTLLQLALPGRTALANQFSRHPLKSRITRLFTPKTNNMKKMLFLLVIPVTIVLLFAFKNIRHKKVQVWKKEPLTVMIDAGHGGSDPGVQVNGVMEKDLTLAISEKIKKHATAAGIKVMMTRSSSEAKPAIIERVQMAEAARPDLLLSIHINNTNGGNTRNGIECYAGGNNTPQQSEQSVQAAKQVLRSLGELGEIKVEQQLQSRGMSIGILKLSPCPAILLECGYLNNSNDFNFITSEEKQDALARKIVQGILAYARERAVVNENQPANDLGAEPVALEGKIPQLYQFPANGTVWVDGKQVAHTTLAEINPEQIAHHVYYEPNNAVAVKKYGKAAAENGLVVLHTKSGKGEYAFIGETEKNKWLEVARAIRRISTTTKYDRFSYTGIDGKTSEVLVLAGGRPSAQNPAFTRFVVGMYGGKPLGPVKFAIDGVNYTEETFVKKLAQLPVNGYEIVYPFP
ncbi:MAG: N-acetylmuramoyl-L-alanine amidase, partial [Dinghuibacter sp.]|nr:N-acetylmuramoyl-L-alanine amidase [Dinghuibacter sp.]